MIQQLVLALIYLPRLYEDGSTITIPLWSAARGRLKQLPPGSAEVNADLGLENAGLSACAWTSSDADAGSESTDPKPMSDESKKGTPDLCAIADRIFLEMANPQRQRRANTPEFEQQAWWRKSAQAQIRELHMSEGATVDHAEGAVLTGSKFWLRKMNSNQYVIATVTNCTEYFPTLCVAEPWPGTHSSELYFTTKTDVLMGKLCRHFRAHTSSEFVIYPERTWTFDETLYNDTVVSMKLGGTTPIQPMASRPSGAKDPNDSDSTMTDMETKPQQPAKKLAGISLVQDWISSVHITDVIARIITEYLLLLE